MKAGLAVFVFVLLQTSTSFAQGAAPGTAGVGTPPTVMNAPGTIQAKPGAIQTTPGAFQATPGTFQNTPGTFQQLSKPTAPAQLAPSAAGQPGAHGFAPPTKSLPGSGTTAKNTDGKSKTTTFKGKILLEHMERETQVIQR
jgi:hypothetical protein